MNKSKTIFQYATGKCAVIEAPSLFHLAPIVLDTSNLPALFQWLKDNPERLLMVRDVHLPTLASQFPVYAAQHEWALQLRYHEIESAIPAQSVLLLYVVPLDGDLQAFESAMHAQLQQFDAAQRLHLSATAASRSRKDRRMPHWHQMKVGEVREVVTRSRNSIYTSLMQARRAHPDLDLTFRIVQEQPGRFRVTRITQEQRRSEYSRRTIKRKRAEYEAAGKPFPAYLEPKLNVSGYTSEQMGALNREIAAIRAKIRDGVYDDDPALIEDFESDPYFFAQFALEMRKEFPCGK